MGEMDALTSKGRIIGSEVPSDRAIAGTSILIEENTSEIVLDDNTEVLVVEEATP